MPWSPPRHYKDDCHCIFTAEEGLEHATLGLGAAVLDFVVHGVPNDYAAADDDDSTCTPGHG